MIWLRTCAENIVTKLKQYYKLSHHRKGLLSNKSELPRVKSKMTKCTVTVILAWNLSRFEIVIEMTETTCKRRIPLMQYKGGNEFKWHTENEMLSSTF